MQPLTIMMLGAIISASSLTMALNGYPFWSAVTALIMGALTMFASLLILAKS